MRFVLRGVGLVALAVSVAGCANWSWPTITNPFAKKPIDLNSPGVAVTLDASGRDSSTGGVPPDMRKQEQETSSAAAERAAKQAAPPSAQGAAQSAAPPAAASTAAVSPPPARTPVPPPSSAKATPLSPDDQAPAPMPREQEQAMPKQQPAMPKSEQKIASSAIAPTPAARYEKFSLQGDALFKFGTFDEVGMLPAGKKKLDDLAAHIKGLDKASIDSIAVVGHADRLGAPEKKMRVSEQRAETVANYLISKGVDAALVQSTGKGDVEPVAQCGGKKATPQLVSCLAPNRRVEVVIKGR
jgi:outer membrane protein OmpA-like peptidoglycan-associated protein